MKGIFYNDKMVNSSGIYNSIRDIYAFNNRDQKYMKQKRTKFREETNNSAIIVGDFNISLSIMDEIIRQKNQGNRGLE